MPTPSFAHRQLIKMALQYAGLDVHTCAYPQKRPCLDVEVTGDVVSLTPVGFVVPAGQPACLRGLRAAEVADVIESFGRDRWEGEEPPEGNATEEEALALWKRIAEAGAQARDQRGAA
jgi:hypothetical protein